MSQPTYLERFLRSEDLRFRTIEFLRVIMSDRANRPMPRSAGPGDPLDSVIHEAILANKACLQITIEQYLSIPAKREFAKMLLLTLVSSCALFQPNRIDEWKSFDELIRELIFEDLIMDPALGMDLLPDEPGEFLLEDLGASRIKLFLHSYRC